MTRLREADLDPVPGRLDAYDAQLREITGASLRQVACRAAGVREPAVLGLLERVRFAAVPVTGGLGVIPGFSEAVAAVVSHLGFPVMVTARPDEAGIDEGARNGADVLLTADDHRFLAITPRGEELADNVVATARGFVTGLELMNGGLEGESVLVLGCGPVGVAAAAALLDRGASVAFCDVVAYRARAARQALAEEGGDRIQVEDDPLTALVGYRLIFDATNAGGLIEAHHLTPATLVAAPGMPCALTPEAMEESRHRILHDPLEIGTATMAVAAAAALAGGRETGEVSGKDWRGTGQP